MYFGTARIGMRHTQVIMRNAEVEEGAGAALDLYAAFVLFLGALDVSFLEFLRALLKASQCLEFRGVGGRGVRCRGRSPALKENCYVPDSYIDYDSKTHVSGCSSMTRTGRICHRATRRERSPWQVDIKGLLCWTETCAQLSAAAVLKALRAHGQPV